MPRVLYIYIYISDVLYSILSFKGTHFSNYCGENYKVTFHL